MHSTGTSTRVVAILLTVLPLLACKEDKAGPVILDSGAIDGALVKTDTAKGGVVGLVTSGFTTGTEAVGAVPSDGTLPGAPKVVGLTAASTTLKDGDPLRVNLEFADPQGNLATINFGLQGQTIHSTLPGDLAAGRTSGILVLDLYPQSYAPGTYVLVVSLADLTGLVSASVTLPFTIVIPGIDAGTAGVDMGSKPGDALATDSSVKSDAATDAAVATDTQPRVDSASTGDAGAYDLAAGDSAKPVDAAMGGYWQRKELTISPPGKPTYAETCCSWEVTWQAGLVTWSGVRDIGGVRSTYVLRFEWSEPPTTIRPGDVWPISAKATIVSVAGSPGVDGSVEARIAGGSLLPLAANGGSTVKVSTNSQPAGTVASATSTTKAGDGGQDFSLTMSAANGNKDYNAEFTYKYQWVP